MNIEKIPEHILRKVQIVAGECWSWTGGTNPKGYGRVSLKGGKNMFVHRMFYEAEKGTIGDGLVIDHLCRNRRCCNPDHLEAVTNAENVRRGRTGKWQIRESRCPRGHEFTPENTIQNSNGSRRCRTCNRISDLERSRRIESERKLMQLKIGGEYEGKIKGILAKITNLVGSQVVFDFDGSSCVLPTWKFKRQFGRCISPPSPVLEETKEESL